MNNEQNSFDTVIPLNKTNANRETNVNMSVHNFNKDPHQYFFFQSKRYYY